MVLNLVLAESSIELVPNEIVHHKSIQSWARRKGKDPHQLVLDQSYHHSAILRLGQEGTGRGRPDIAHFSLLLALGSPLNKEDKLRCFVHTRDDHLITVNPKARLPRNTDRFTSLLEQLYEDSAVPASGEPLMTLKRESLSTLVKRLTSDLVVALTSTGRQKTMDVVAEKLKEARTPVLLVGGFPAGHFSQKTEALASQKYCIDSRTLEAWTVVGRAVYDFEKAIGLRRFWQNPALN